MMSFMIEVVGTGIRPHAAPLTQYLPGLWHASTDHNLLRCAILTTLVHMVTGLMVCLSCTGTNNPSIMTYSEFSYHTKNVCNILLNESPVFPSFHLVISASFFFYIPHSRYCLQCC